MVPFTVDRVRDRKRRRGGCGGKEKEKKKNLKCDSNSINAFLSLYREPEWYLY